MCNNSISSLTTCLVVDNYFKKFIDENFMCMIVILKILTLNLCMTIILKNLCMYYSLIS